jgi:5-histidylcysteine sulfoxide synthase/putative 4-mercaptohistidine N1-methyltranferase
MKRVRNPNLDIFLNTSESRAVGSSENSPIFGARWWTGQKPKPDETLKSLPIPDLATCTSDSVLAYFDNTWILTEILFSSLKTEAAFLIPPYHGLRHPLIFYYAHPVTFYVNKLRVAGLIDSPLNPYFEQLFETGVDEMTWDDISKNEMEWPSLQEVHEYRRAVYQKVRSLIETHPDLKPGHPVITSSHPLWALFMGFEHERIHLETSSVLIRELPLTCVQRPLQWPALATHNSSPSSPTNRLISVEEDRVTLGKPDTVNTFGWDNEYGKKEVLVPKFEASAQLISNGEFLEFVRLGGYNEKAYWTEIGWKWCSQTHSLFPAFWVPKGPQGIHDYALRTLFEVIDLPLDWPAIVNFHEAKAYANWRTQADNSFMPYRLLTEAEHHRLRSFGSGANLNLKLGSESPVQSQEHELPFNDVFGNVWQWCEDHFYALPGFKIHPFYEDFSTPCFDSQHQMILGGSFVSTGDEATYWARFHFRPHFFQHSGFRLVRSQRDTLAAQSGYEGSQILNPYLLLHFGSPQETVSYPLTSHSALRFPQRCAELLVDWMRRKNQPTNRVIDVGCAVGGAVFTLAESFQEALGVDLSSTLIEAAKTLKQKGYLNYEKVEEGEITTPLVAQVHSELARERSHFRQADAGSLPSELFGFDAVLLANLLCRVPSPRTVLQRMSGERGLLRSGGILVITTPFTWLEKFSPKEVWLGGYQKNGEPIFSEPVLKNLLENDFILLERTEMPLLIREHARKFEYIVPLVTVWQKK